MRYKNIKIGHIFLLVFLVASTNSCKKDDFLNVPPKGVLTDISTFSSQSNADLFVNDIYNQLQDFNNIDSGALLDAWTDNSNSGAPGQEGQSRIRSNALSSGNATNGPSNVVGWTTMYTNIRKCNVFLKDAAANPNIYDATWYKQRVAEVKFLRALWYLTLFKNYGGLPLITIPLNNLDGSDIFTARATFDQTLAFIEADCDAAALDLPLTQNTANLGRATKGAALALKADAELFAASPLVNTSNDVTKWAKAAATNKAVMDLGIYSLFTKSAGPGSTGTGPLAINSTTGSGTTSTAFRDQFLAVNNWNPETIFAKAYSLPNKGHKREGFMGPVIVKGGQQAWGNIAPTQSLVDDYEMDNGKPITDPTSGYDPQHPYLHRESRFEQSIIYDGSYWQGEVYMSRIGGSNQIDLGSTSDITNTGYNGRKTLDESILGQTSLANPASGTSNYQFYRYAEILLSYAEAQNEAVGPDQNVYAAVNKIRERVLLPALPVGLSQADMRTNIRRERRLEFTFEDKRWYDIRRWDITVKGPAVLNTPEYGMVITATGGVLKYTPTIVFQNRYSEYMNFLPIPQNIINSNPKLTQNPGY